MMTRKTRRVQRRCIICVGEVNVIVTYIILQAFVITISQLFLHQIYGNFTTDFQTI